MYFSQLRDEKPALIHGNVIRLLVAMTMVNGDDVNHDIMSRLSSASRRGAPVSDNTKAKARGQP